MFRTKMITTVALAGLGLALAGTAALAQPSDERSSNAPPAQLNGNPNSDRDAPPRSNEQRSYDQGQYDQAQNTRDNDRSRDLFCRRDAAARTGYVSPGQAASRAQTSSSVGGTLLGAAAGAAIGSASGNAGAGALIGAGAGLIAGTAVGENNARRAADDVERAYGDAYYACMDEADAYPDDARTAPPVRYAYDYPPPVYAYYPPPPVYYAPYPYYGPSISLGFGFGGGYHRSFGGYYGGGHGGFRGGFGGGRHR
jgi:hypothetical protein